MLFNSINTLIFFLKKFSNDQKRLFFLFFLAIACTPKSINTFNFAAFLAYPLEFPAYYYPSEIWFPPLLFSGAGISQSLSHSDELISGNVTISAFLDQNCTISASSVGHLTGIGLTQSFQNSVANYFGLTFQLESTVAPGFETPLYLLNEVKSNDRDSSFCSKQFFVIQHFKRDYGYFSSLVPSPAGETLAASQNDQANAIAMSSTGALWAVGPSAAQNNAIQGAALKILASGSVDLSTSFGSTSVTGLTGTSQMDIPRAALIDSTGNLLVAGSAKNSSGGFQAALWRVLTSSGSLDTSFSNGAIGYSSFSGSVTQANENDQNYALAIDSSRRILTAGCFYNGTGTLAFVRRWSSLGVLDTNFGSNGSWISASPAGASNTQIFDCALAMTLDSSQNILLAGHSSNGAGLELALWKVSPEGISVSSFGNLGASVSGTRGAAGAIGSQENDQGLGIAIDSTSDKIVVAGRSFNGSGTEAALWRYNPDGSLDSSFNVQTSGSIGNAGATGGATFDVAKALVIKNNQYFMAGTSKNASGGLEAALWCYLPSNGGQLNSDFGSTLGFAGAMHFAVLGSGLGSTLDQVNNMIVDASGLLFLAGTAENSSGGKAMTFWRLFLNGEFDS